VLPSPMSGTADLPPVAEGRDAALASLVNLRSSGSPEPVELPFVHAPTGTMTPRGGRMVRCVARRGCGVFRESGAARRGGRMVPAEAVRRAGRVAHPEPRVMC
jgi:hypothetical protein